MAGRHKPDETIGGPAARDRVGISAAEGLIPAEVLEQLLALDASYRLLEHSGQVVLELHYHEGRRKKAWVRAAAVYDVQEA